MITGKVWGSTELLLATPFIEIHHLIIKPNARCSMHTHAQKFNAFYVIEGELSIEVEKKDYPLTDVTVLGSGKFTSVKPLEYHRFIAGPHGAEALEIYYPAPLAEDIVRRDHGAAPPIEQATHWVNIEDSTPGVASFSEADALAGLLDAAARK